MLDGTGRRQTGTLGPIEENELLVGEKKTEVQSGAA